MHVLYPESYRRTSKPSARSERLDGNLHPGARACEEASTKGKQVVSHAQKIVKVGKIDNSRLISIYLSVFRCLFLSIAPVGSNGTPGIIRQQKNPLQIVTRFSVCRGPSRNMLSSILELFAFSFVTSFIVVVFAASVSCSAQYKQIHYVCLRCIFARTVEVHDLWYWLA